MKLLALLPPGKWTIGQQIVLAFSAFGGIATALAGLTVFSVDRAGDLVHQTFDAALVTTNFARAAADDFSRMRAEFAWHRNDGGSAIAILDKSFRADLATALDKGTTPEMAKIGEELRKAEIDWLAKNQRIAAGAPATAKDLADLEAAARTIDSKIEAMTNLIVDAAESRRDAAGAMVAGDTIVAILAAVLGIFGCVVAGFALHRAIKAPLQSAVEFADGLAGGRLNTRPPQARDNEIGRLIHAMTSMRDNVKAMVDEEVERREISHDRIAEALNSSLEGVIVADGEGVIQIANIRALDFLGLDGKKLRPGATLESVRQLVGVRDSPRQVLLEAVADHESGRETTLPDGRRVRASRNRTKEGGFVGLYTDITAIAKQQESLAAANTSLDAALASMSQGLCVFDAGNRLRIANRRCYAIFGFDPNAAVPGTAYEMLLDMSIAQGNHKTVDPDRLRRHERHVIARHRFKTTRLIPFGRDRTLAITHAPMADGGWLATYEDVTERRQADARIAHVANHDALTGLPNRGMMGKRVESAIARANRGAGFVMLYLDLDHFKQVNDTLGHAVGDDLLKMVAERLMGLVHRLDTVARLGGDEFAVLQANVSTREESAALARRIIDAVSAPYEFGNNAITIGTSIGIASAPQDGLSFVQLLKNADLALYRAKEEGRGTFRFFEAEMHERLAARLALERDLKRAATGREFELHYQPVLDLTSMGIGSFEALVRWNHPRNGLTMPGNFIPAAEQTGTINAIGAWVLREACAQAATWPDDIRVAVNVSIVQLCEAGFADIVEQALAATGLRPERLELEITESVFMTNNAKAMESLKALKSLGIIFAMDDFGTGYSSLSYLRRFAFDKIKIDRSFLNNLMESDGAEQIIRTVVTLGKNLGMRVTAEGVETPKQLKFLSDIGCDEIQGYLVGRPMQAALINATLEQHNGRRGLDGMAA